MNRFCIFRLVLIALIAPGCNKHQHFINTDLKELKLKGQVKSISEINYSSTGKYTTHVSFDPDGFILEQSSNNPDGTLIRKWKFEYNNQNQKITRYCYVLKDSLSEVLQISYDKYGKITEERLHNAQGGIISIVEHQYDTNQYETERRFKNETGKVQGLIAYKYDENHNITEEINSDSVFHQHWKQKNNYNKDGLLEEIVYLSLNDSLIKRSNYKYLSDKQISDIFFYNNKNELISQTSYEYDEEKNVTGKLIYYADKKIPEKNTFEYVYDKNKNWTTQKIFIDNEPIGIITRQLEYY